MFDLFDQESSMNFKRYHVNTKKKLLITARTSTLYIDVKLMHGLFKFNILGDKVFQMFQVHTIQTL